MNDELSDNELRASVFGIHDSEDIDNFKHWTDEYGRSVATKMGIDLTDKHWEVIHFLRVHFQNVGGEMPPVHELSQTLEERFTDEGGLKYLYELFPGGPINQGGLIAGISIPFDTTDPSFGSVH